MCSNRERLTSHIALRLQLGSPLKLRTRLGPQYPHPTTPTTIGFFILPPIHPHLSCRPWPISVLFGKASLPRCCCCSKATIRAAPTPTGKEFIGHDFCWLSNIFEVFIRTDNTNPQAASGKRSPWANTRSR